MTGITVTNGEAMALLSNPIWTNRMLPVKTRYWLTRIADKFHGIAKLTAKEREAIILDNCVKGADGKPAIEGNKYKFDPPEKEAEANKAITDLMAIVNVLPWERQIVDLATVPAGFDMSAADMADVAAVVEFTFSEVA